MRALRALSFLTSHNEAKCITILKKGLRDKDPIVQERALDVLLNLDMRKTAPQPRKNSEFDVNDRNEAEPHPATPRDVLKEVLLEIFSQQTKREVILDPEAIGENFRLNRGLLRALSNISGVRVLTVWFLLLWVTMAFLTIFTALRVAMRSVFIELPNRIRVIPNIWHRLGSSVWFLIYRLLVVFYALLILLPAKIISTPVWTRKLPFALKSLRNRYFYLALLDYALIYLLVVVGQPYGLLRLTIAIAGFLLLLIVSMPFTNPRQAERFRAFSRATCTSLLAVYVYHYGHGGRLAIAIFLLAAIQALWMLVWLGQVVYSRRTALREAWIKFCEDFTPHPDEIHRGNGQRATQAARRILRSMAAAGYQESRRFLGNLRPRRKHVVVFAIIVIVLISSVVTLSYALNGRTLDPLDPQFTMLGLPLDQLLLRVSTVVVRFKLTAYLVVGLIAMVIAAAVVLCIIRVLWDESLIVDRIRASILSKNPERFKSTSNFIDYQIAEIRRSDRPPRNRVRAVRSLGKALRKAVPGSEQHSRQFYNLAGEDLPQVVRGAILLEVEELLISSERGQPDTITIDLEGLNKIRKTWWPGEAFRPIIFKGLGLLLAISLLLGFREFYYFRRESTHVATLAILVLGCGLLALYIVTAKRRLQLPKWSLLFGLILLSTAFTHSLLSPAIPVIGVGSFRNGIIGLFELSVLSSLAISIISACIVAQAAHTAYLLGSDAEVEFEAEEKTDIFERRMKRFEHQPYLGSRALLIVMAIAIIAQSEPLREYLELRNERMPSFSVGETGSQVDLKGIPTDGRFVRVAIIRVENPSDENPPGNDGKRSFQSISAEALDVLREGGIAALDPKNIGKEVWITSQNGEPRVLWGSPRKCMEATRFSGDTVTLDVSACLHKVKFRLVAIVYDKRRSSFLKGLSLTGVSSEQRLDALLLVDTFSPFVRAVWSPTF